MVRQRIRSTFVQPIPHSFKIRSARCLPILERNEKQSLRQLRPGAGGVTVGLRRESWEPFRPTMGRISCRTSLVREYTHVDERRASPVGIVSPIVNVFLRNDTTMGKKETIGARCVRKR